jgi:23S rRNA pseudouridine2605 synthase
VNFNHKETYRIAHYMGMCGVASRRESELLVQSGVVKVNGVTVVTPVAFVRLSDEVCVHGARIGLKKTRIWAYHKPVGLVVTHSISSHEVIGKGNIFDDFRSSKLISSDKSLSGEHSGERVGGHVASHFISVGRLDVNTEGLLLITNNGMVSRFLEMPCNNTKRVYKVRVNGKIDDKKLDIIRRGVTLDGIRYRGCRIHILGNTIGNIFADGPENILDSNNERSASFDIKSSRKSFRQSSNFWLEIELTEGKNREVRKLLQYAGLQVSRLIRTSYGPYHLGDLKTSDVVECDSSLLNLD